VAFSGRLGYRPNALAMERLLERIWPRVRSVIGDAVLAVGGADARPGSAVATARTAFG